MATMLTRDRWAVAQMEPFPEQRGKKVSESEAKRPPADM